MSIDAHQPQGLAKTASEHSGRERLGTFAPSIQDLTVPKIAPELNVAVCESLISTVDICRKPGAPSFGGTWLDIAWYSEGACGLHEYAAAKNEVREARQSQKLHIDASRFNLLPEVRNTEVLASVLASGAYLKLYADGRIFQQFSDLISSRLVLRMSEQQMEQLDQKLASKVREQFPEVFAEAVHVSRHTGG